MLAHLADRGCRSESGSSLQRERTAAGGEVAQSSRLSKTLLRYVGGGPSTPGCEDSTGACTCHPSHRTSPLVAVAVVEGFERPEQLQRQCRRRLP